VGVGGGGLRISGEYVKVMRMRGGGCDAPGGSRGSGKTDTNSYTSCICITPRRTLTCGRPSVWLI